MNVISIVCDTLRRDHCGPYHHGKPLNQCGSSEQPNWVVPTPNMDRLATKGTVFDYCWCGSTPCMPARRDIYTGRYEFLERGWGPLEEEDQDLPRLISGSPNQSLSLALKKGHKISYLVSDHFHLWEQGAGNYHMGYSGFDFVRGCESDAYYTDPVDFFCPESERDTKTERHHRNIHFIRKQESDYFPAQVFTRASEWLDRNHTHENFYLHIDCFCPHEPWDPPEELVKLFDPEGYLPGWRGNPPYAPWKDNYTERELRNIQARYAAQVVLLDRWLGKLLDAIDRNNLWEDTLVIFTSDHGTFNGDHVRVGKLQTHEFDAVGHIPLIIAHPTLGHGERRSQLTQLVDLFPTTLAAIGKPIPEHTHGVNLLLAIESKDAKTRNYAIAGQFGKSVTITDGKWALHQSPVSDNQPLYWYGHCLAKFLYYDLDVFKDGKRHVRKCESWPTPTWLSDKSSDPNELVNLADSNPKKLKQMQEALKNMLLEIKAPCEQIQRLGL